MNTTVRKIERIRLELSMLALEMIQHEDNTGPDSEPHKCYLRIQEQQAAVDVQLIAAKEHAWRHAQQAGMVQ